MKLILVSLLALLSGCMGTIPKWDGKIWLNDSDKGQPTRVNEDGSRVYSDYTLSEFHAARVLKKEDFETFWKTYILGCKEWKDGLDMVSAGEFMSMHAKALRDTRHDN